MFLDQLKNIDVIYSSYIPQPLQQVLFRREIPHKIHTSFEKYAKKIKKPQLRGVIIGVQTHTDQSILLDFVQKIKQNDENSKVLLLVDPNIKLSLELEHTKGLFQSLYYDESLEVLEKKLESFLDCRFFKIGSGKSKILSEHLLKPFSNCPVVGDYFEVHAGLSIQNPLKHLGKTQTHDKKIEIIANGQIHPFVIKSEAYFWNGDLSIVLSSPPATVFQNKEKLLMHSVAPPLKVAIDRDRRAFGKNTLALIPKKELPIPLRVYAGFFNSRLFDFFMNKMFNPVYRLGAESSFLSDHDVKHLPIPGLIFEGTILKIDKCVEQLESLLSWHPTGKNKEIRDLKEEMNQTFFDIYQLNEEHVQLLEELHF